MFICLSLLVSQFFAPQSETDDPNPKGAPTALHTCILYCSFHPWIGWNSRNQLLYRPFTTRFLTSYGQWSLYNSIGLVHLQCGKQFLLWKNHAYFGHYICLSLQWQTYFLNLKVISSNKFVLHATGLYTKPAKNILIMKVGSLHVLIVFLTIKTICMGYWYI